MDFSEDVWRKLAAHLGVDDPRSTPRSQEELAVHLLPLVRSILRNGIGRPKLAAWVRGHLPDDANQHPEGLVASAPHVARLLSTRLVQKLQESAPARPPALETICGR